VDAKQLQHMIEKRDARANLSITLTVKVQFDFYVGFRCFSFKTAGPGHGKTPLQTNTLGRVIVGQRGMACCLSLNSNKSKTFAKIISIPASWKSAGIRPVFGICGNRNSHCRGLPTNRSTTTSIYIKTISGRLIRNHWPLWKT
jgi:hypothetical protein